jgi:hypothetical protein
MLLISPLGDENVVDHTLTDQSSIIRFIEDNWLDGERIQPGGSFDTIAGDVSHLFKSRGGNDRDAGNSRKLILNPSTGAVVHY